MSLSQLEPLCFYPLGSVWFSVDFSHLDDPRKCLRGRSLTEQFDQSSCHCVDASHLYWLDDCPDFFALPLRWGGRLWSRFIAVGGFRVGSRSAWADDDRFERSARVRPDRSVSLPANGTVGALQSREETEAIRICRKTCRWRGPAKSRVQCPFGGIHGRALPARGVRLSR